MIQRSAFHAGTWCTWSLLLFTLAPISMAQAQEERIGCHFRSAHAPAPRNLTDAEREQIEETIARSDTFDIKHYDIAIDITDVTGQQIKATTTISFVPLVADRTSIRFDLVNLTVDSVTVPGGPLGFVHEGGILQVQLPVPPAVGELQTLAVHYHGTPLRDPEWGGFYFANGYIYNLGIGLSTIPPNFGKVWYPCFDSFVERAAYTYHVKSAGAYRAHCQGDFLGEVQLGGDTVVRTFQLTKEIPTHISAIAASTYADHDAVHTGQYGEVPYRLTAKTGQLSTMVTKFQHLGNAIDVCEHWYGPYGWDRVGYVLTTAGALEIPQNVAYPDFMNNQTDLANRELFTHELGHHWWGDMVTPRTHNDMWVKEGPAEYSGHLLEEWIGGYQGFRTALISNQLRVLRTAHKQDGGFQPLSPMPDPYIYGIHTYYKGASVMHNLRGYLGDTLFRQAMHGVQEDHAQSTLSAAQLRDALEAATGADLHPFFQDQVFTPGFSVFVVKQLQATEGEAGWEVALDVQQRLRGTDQFHTAVPLDVTLIGADHQRQEYRVTVGGALTNVSLVCDFEPVMAVLNGHTRLNQARIDHEFMARVGQTLAPSQGSTGMMMFQVELPDSALVRIDHIWAGPQTSTIGTGIAEVSDSHSWIIDGLWPEGTVFRGRFDYVGGQDGDLDRELFGVTELGATLVYRATPDDPWTVAPGQVLSANILTNGAGYITVQPLLRGEYTFAKSDPFSAVSEVNAQTAVSVFPVPARNQVTVRSGGRPVQAMVDILAADGRVVRTERVVWGGDQGSRIDVSGLGNGVYQLQARDLQGIPVGTARFTIER